jgi:hypothetical protein
MKIKNLRDIARCEKCNLEFPAKDVKLKPLEGKVMMAPLMTQLVIIEPDGEIVAVSDTRFAKPGSAMMHCPMCEAMHAFGFERPEIKDGGVMR